MSNIKEVFTNTPDTTAAYSVDDIQSNKVMGIFAYISYLVLIPFFAAKGSKYARFNVNQGLILAIVELANLIIFGVLFQGWFAALIEWLINVVCGIFSVVGIVNVAKGKAKELPFIGKFKILK